MLLAALFGVLAVGVVGMHLLSVDHRLAGAKPDRHHGTAIVTSAGHEHAGHDHAVVDHSVGDHGSVPLTFGTGHDCAECDHVMMLGCLLVMVFGLLWRLLAPTTGPSWPLLRTGAVSGDPPVTYALATTRRAAHTHLELSISRT